MRLDDDVDTNKAAPASKPKPAAKAKSAPKQKREFGNVAMGNAFADAFANAKVKK